MKFLLLLFLVSASPGLAAQTLPDSLVRSHQIYRVVTTRTVTTKGADGSYSYTLINTTLYNRQGQPVISIDRTKNAQDFGKDSSVTKYFYTGNQLSKIEWKEYMEGHVDQGFENYEYRFDDQKRKLSVGMRNEFKRQTREDFTYDSSGNITTVLFFSNDSAVYIPQRNGYNQLQGTLLKLKKIQTNSWSADGRITRTVDCLKECRWKYQGDSFCCSTTNFFYKGDTSIQQHVGYYSGQWQTGTSKTYTMLSGAEFEETERGDQRIRFRQKNAKGLVTRIESCEISIEGWLQMMTTTHQYQFYKNLSPPAQSRTIKN